MTGEKIFTIIPKPDGKGVSVQISDASTDKPADVEFPVLTYYVPGIIPFWEQRQRLKNKYFREEAQKELVRQNKKGLTISGLHVEFGPYGDGGSEDTYIQVQGFVKLSLGSDKDEFQFILKLTDEEPKLNQAPVHLLYKDQHREEVYAIEPVQRDQEGFTYEDVLKRVSAYTTKIIVEMADIIFGKVYNHL